MPGKADRLGLEATMVARYDTLREVANQLAGVLVARQRDARSLDSKHAWRNSPAVTWGMTTGCGPQRRSGSRACRPRSRPG